MKSKYSATFGNGAATSRISENLYTHAWRAVNKEARYDVFGFAGSKELAGKAASRFVGKNDYTGIEVVEVVRQ